MILRLVNDGVELNGAGDGFPASWSRRCSLAHHGCMYVLETEPKPYGENAMSVVG